MKAATTTAELAQAEHDLQRAVVRQDRAVLEALMGPEFSLTSARMNVARDEWIAIATGPYNAESFEFLDLRVQPFGDVAVVDTRMRGRARMGEIAAPPLWRITDVWVHRDDRWEIVKRCGYPLSDEDAGSSAGGH